MLLYFLYPRQEWSVRKTQNSLFDLSYDGLVSTKDGSPLLHKICYSTTFN